MLLEHGVDGIGSKEGANVSECSFTSLKSTHLKHEARDVERTRPKTEQLTNLTSGQGSFKWSSKLMKFVWICSRKGSFEGPSPNLARSPNKPMATALTDSLFCRERTQKQFNKCPEGWTCETGSGTQTFSKHGRMRREMLMSMGLMWDSSISARTLESPPMASRVMLSSISSLSSIPAIMADSTVVENLLTWRTARARIILQYLKDWSRLKWEEGPHLFTASIGYIPKAPNAKPANLTIGIHQPSKQPIHEHFHQIHISSTLVIDQLENKNKWLIIIVLLYPSRLLLWLTWAKTAAAMILCGS